MAKEVERKFLVAGDGWRSSVERSVAVLQFYVALGSGRSVRVRIRDGREALLTLKFGTQAKIRDEYEYAVPLPDALEMRGFAIGDILDKTRHLVRHGRHLFEVDEFHGALERLLIAELETADRVADDLLPPWLGREVTGDTAYYNASLATAGMPAKTI